MDQSPNTAIDRDVVRAEAAKILDDLAALQDELAHPRCPQCFPCREAAMKAASLRFAAAALRDPRKLLEP